MHVTNSARVAFSCIGMIEPCVYVFMYRRRISKPHGDISAHTVLIIHFFMSRFAPLSLRDSWNAGVFENDNSGFFWQMGGGCQCSCERPDNAHWAEADNVEHRQFRARMEMMRIQLRAHCECDTCGKWPAGPLRVNAQHKITGCCNVVIAGDRMCTACGLHNVKWPSGSRTSMAGA